MRLPFNDNRPPWDRPFDMRRVLVWWSITALLALFWSFTGMWLYDLLT
ncbi:hypothetical protein FP2506_08346 [Fulvimarina pelagi HTCC2506]|uniref:Uncharacterized protein n=1 Tax=Fulvimarina pelagi HTCC2506 TaxID=314231 RepID=Q0G677_9HYPH|nr:hypothetical protein FP2506_08346 [Fulvimarina pelagi HTCC2506]